jgi:hypothetical protein
MLAVGVPSLLLASIGCNVFSDPPESPCTPPCAPTPTEVHIDASVTATDPDTGLPVTLSGRFTGELEGDYEETILDLYFDATGAPIAALSRSIFTVQSPEPATLISLNSIVVLDNVFLEDPTGTVIVDADGLPVVVGFTTSATGEIISCNGCFEGTTGHLYTESTLMFTGGDLGLGASSTDLIMTFESASSDEAEASGASARPIPGAFAPNADS